MNREQIKKQEKAELVSGLKAEYQKLSETETPDQLERVLKAVANYLEGKDNPKAESYNALGYEAHKIVQYLK